MSGAIGSNGIDYASLFPISSASSNGVAGQILRALYGGGPGLTGSSGVNPIIALQDAQANETTDVANEAKQPQVQQAVAAFTKAVDSATSIKSLLQNPDFLNVFLTANGLGSETAYPALAQQEIGRAHA